MTGCSVEILLFYTISELIVLSNLKRGLFQALLLKNALVLSLSEILKSLFSHRLSIDALVMDAFFQENTNLIKCIRLLVLRGILIIR